MTPEQKEELEARYRKAVKALEGERRAALKKTKGTAGKGKKAKEALERYVLHVLAFRLRVRRSNAVSWPGIPPTCMAAARVFGRVLLLLIVVFRSEWLPVYPLARIPLRIPGHSFIHSLTHLAGPPPSLLSRTNYINNTTPVVSKRNTTRSCQISNRSTRRN